MKLRSDKGPEWIRAKGPDSDIVISTRARLARSLAAYPFPARCSGEDLTMVVRDVRGACGGLGARFPGLLTISMDKLDADQKSMLLDARIVSFEQTDDKPGAAVIVEPSAVLSIMINEEDHIRIQVLRSGLVPCEAWELADWVDDVLAESLDYGYSERYGYLTANVSNVGTGLRVSALMHLAGLAMTSRLTSQLRAAYDLGVSIRGLFGEGSRSVGDLYQVSNEVTLGLCEREIVQRVASVAQYLLEQERLARKELLSDQGNRLIETSRKSLAVLKGSRSITPEKAITFMSALRLAAALGLASNCPISKFNEMLVEMRVGAADGIRAGLERAEVLRNALADVDITG